MAELRDVIAVDESTNKILWVERNKSERNAEAIITMAVMRQGCDDRFFTDAPCGKYNDGDEYAPDDAD